MSMKKANEDGLEENTPRTIKFVLEDDGKTQFKFYMEGDTERLNLPSIPASLYSAAEWWAVQLFAVCQDHLNRHGEVKKLNREERRKNE